MSNITRIDHGFVELPGRKIYDEKAGEGEPVVFLPHTVLVAKIIFSYINRCNNRSEGDFDEAAH
jgi:hypothetical protein